MNLVSFYFNSADSLLLFYIVLLTGLMLPNCILIYESPTWLLKQGEVHKAAETLRSIAEVNGTSSEANPYIESFEVQLSRHHFNDETNNIASGIMGKIRLVISDTQILKSLIILSGISSAQFCLFYAISSSIQDLGYHTIQANGIIMGITHGCGFLLVIPFLSSTPRKGALLTIQSIILLEAAALFGLGCFPQTATITHIQAFIASVLVSSTLSAMYSFSYLANAESFPAEIRGFCVGFILLVGKAVGSTCPYITMESKSLGIHLLVGCSMPMVVSLLMTLGLKETLPASAEKFK